MVYVITPLMNGHYNRLQRRARPSSSFVAHSPIVTIHQELNGKVRRVMGHNRDRSMHSKGHATPWNCLGVVFTCM